MPRAIVLTATVSVFLSVYFGVSAFSRGNSKASKQPVVISATLPSPRIRFDKPISHSVEGERGQMKIINALAGQMVHSFYIERGQARYPPSYFAIHKLESQKAEASTLSFQAHRLQPGYGAIWAPQFSPNGRYILFKYGASTSFEGPYEIFVFDTQKQTLVQVTNLGLAYDQVSWSPDSNYIAFIKNGNALGEATAIQGNEVVDLGVLQLMVCNWRTKKVYPVVSSNSLRGSFDWAPPHTLVYGMTPEDKSHSILPGVYEYSVEENRSQLLFPDGFCPAPSPSGRKVSFLENKKTVTAPTPLQKGQDNYSSGSVLSVINRDGSGRVELSGEIGRHPFVGWLPDEEHLITINQTKVWQIKSRSDSRMEH